MTRRVLQGQYAGFLSRAAAFIIDLVMIAIIFLIVSWFVTTLVQQFLKLDIANCPAVGGTTSRLLVGVCNGFRIALLIVGIFFGPVYFILLWMLTGQTVGKYIMGVRIVRLDGHHVDFLAAVIRFVGYFISLIPLGLGFLRVLISDQRRGWHDQLAGTCVIYAWEAHQNEKMLDRARRLIKRRRET